MIGQAGVLAGLDFLEFARRLLVLVEAVNDPGKQLAVACPEQDQPFFLLGLAGRPRAVGQDERVAENLVADLRPGDAQALAERLLQLAELEPLRRLAQRLAEGGGADALDPRRAQELVVL